MRTVQFYDTKDLLKPYELTEGGRRLYSDADLNTLRLICMLKSLGLTLSSIKGILDSENKSKVLLLLLDEQARLITGDMEDKRKQLHAIRIMQDSIRGTDAIPVQSISGMEHIMISQKKLRRTHGMMLAVGIVMDIVQIAAILYWIFRGIWWPFAVGMPLVILMGILMTRIYCRNTAYICANCNTHFKPRMREFFFAKHTPKTRKLTCPSCGAARYCVETGSEG